MSASATTSFSFVIPVTRAADSTTGGWYSVSIEFVVRMSGWAMCFLGVLTHPSLLKDRLATNHVFAMRHWSDVVWVATRRIVADEVVKLTPFRNRPIPANVGENMGSDGFAVPPANSESAVAEVSFSSQPDMTACFLVKNPLGVKALINRRSGEQRKAIASNSGVTSVAVTSYPTWPDAVFRQALSIHERAA